MTNLTVYRMPAVLKRFGVSETTLRRWMKDEGFPKPRQLGPRSVGWIATEVDGWLQDRPVAGRGDSRL